MSSKRFHVKHSQRRSKDELLTQYLEDAFERSNWPRRRRKPKALDLIAGIVWAFVAAVAAIKRDWLVCGCSLSASAAHLELWYQAP
jgi:hypothetical protein